MARFTRPSLSTLSLTVPTVLAALALSACSSERDEEMARELAEAKAAAAEAEAARIAAEQTAAQARLAKRNESYAAFYGHEDTAEEEDADREEPESADSASGASEPDNGGSAMEAAGSEGFSPA